MGYKTEVIIYDDRIDPIAAHDLVKSARIAFNLFNADRYVTDDYIVKKMADGFRVTKKYKLGEIR